MQELHEKATHQLRKEVIHLQSIVTILQENNATLNNHFQCCITEKISKADSLESTMEKYFHNLVDEFQTKSDRLDDLEEEVVMLFTCEKPKTQKYHMK